MFGDQPKMLSAKDGSTVVMIPHMVNEDLWSLDFSVLNQSDIPQEVKENALTITVDSKSVRVPTRSDLLARERRSELSDNLGLGLVAAGNAIQQPVTRTETSISTFQGTLDSRELNERADFSGTTTTRSTTVDEVATAMNREEAKQRLDELQESKRRRHSEQLANIERGAFRNTIIAPHTGYDGSFEFPLPKSFSKARRVDISLSVQDLEHTFTVILGAEPTADELNAIRGQGWMLDPYWTSPAAATEEP